VDRRSGLPLQPGRHRAAHPLTLAPESRGIQLFSAFVQDEIRLKGDELVLALGAKLEHSTLSGVELQPTARLLWEATSRHTLWTSVSRAVHTPSRGEHDGTSWVLTQPPSTMTGYLPVAVHFVGNPEYGSQELIALEAGWRYQPIRRLSLDVAAFHNRYDRLRVLAPGTVSFEMGPVPHLVYALRSANGQRARSWGVEALAQYEMTRFWRLSGSYSWMRLNLPDPAADGVQKAELHKVPHHQANLRSYLDLPGRLELDLAAYFVDDVRQDVPGMFPLAPVPSYLRADVRLAWQATSKLELNITGQNLLDNQHPEFTAEAFAERSEIRRAVSVGLRVQF